MQHSSIEDEILALGGTKDDLELVAGVSSESEFEDKASRRNNGAMSSLSKELQEMVKGFGFDNVSPEDIAIAEDEDEIEDDQMTQEYDLTPKSTLVQANSNDNKGASQLIKASGKSQSQLVGDVY